MAVCTYAVTIQREGPSSCNKKPQDTTTSEAVCQTGKGCTPRCKDASQTMFLRPQPKVISCDPLDGWGNKKTTLPYKIQPCGKKSPAKIKLNLKIKISLTNCDDATKALALNQVKADLKKLNICGECPIENVAWKCSGRRRRSNRNKRATSAELTSSVPVTSTCTSGSSTPVDTVLQSAIDSGHFSISSGSVTAEPVCDAGKQAMKDANGCWQCVECTAGTYYDAATKTCKDCPKGQYQEAAAQTTCKPCGTDKTTITTRTDALSKCITECKAGNFYVIATQTCKKCEIGFFQDRNGQVSCVACGTGKTTAAEGSNNPNQCVRKYKFRLLFFQYKTTAL